VTGTRPPAPRPPRAPGEFFEEALHSPLEWPGKVTRLARDSLQDVRQRSTSAGFAVSELYHENSKLYPPLLGELAAARWDARSIRESAMARAALTARGSPTASPSAFPTARSLLRAASRPARVDLLYATELLLADHSLVVRYEPIDGRLVELRRIAGHEVRSLRRALQLDADEADSTFLLFVVGAFTRNEMLFGTRGYRRTLIEAGRLAEILSAAAEASAVAVRPVVDFHDRVVDGFLGLDGVERGTLLVLEMEARGGLDGA
jgi:hypothetical protein